MDRESSVLSHRYFPFFAGLLATICCWLFFVSDGAAAAGGERAFWVWNRAAPLTAPERAALRAAGVNRMYWQTGELEIHGGELVFRRTASLPSGVPSFDHDDGLEIVPVMRVSTSIHSPEQFSAEAFGRLLRPVADAAPGREVQIDFDCPDRLLPVYAERLRAARRIADLRRLTITALAGWVDIPASTSLWSAVDAVFPMLYDLESDLAPPPNPGEASRCQPRPLLNPDELGAQLRRWSRCPVPWHAGLPVFTRVTLYDAGGKSLGHLRAWDWEDFVFNPALALDRPSADGTTILRVLRPTLSGDSRLPVDGYVAMREAGLATLRSGIAGAAAAGASGVIFFSLPEPPALIRTTGSGPSLAQLLTLLAPAIPAANTARLSLHRADDGTERWVLRNDSNTDLPPRITASERGYGLELEITGRASGWREGLAGDFHRVVGHAFTIPAGATPGDNDRPVPVAIPLARRLTFWFAELPAHAALTTGLVQFAPGLDARSVRFRLPVGDHPETTPWQSPE